jgi:hypothetical protein
VHRQKAQQAAATQLVLILYLFSTYFVLILYLFCTDIKFTQGFQYKMGTRPNLYLFCTYFVGARRAVSSVFRVLFLLVFG